MNIEAALITDARYVNYFTGHWNRSILPCALLIPANGDTLLSTAVAAEDDVVADQKEVYTSSHLATLVDYLPSVSLEPLLSRLGNFKKIGCDNPPILWQSQQWEFSDLGPTLLSMRRHKDADEADMIRRAVTACEAAYSRAREILEPGITEVRVYSEMLAAATEAVGESIGEMGNDFQAGSLGGLPRRRAVEAGELMPLDVSVTVRGYNCDLCRTFAVNRQPTAAQMKCHELVSAALSYLESTAGPGTSCRRLYQEIHSRLDGQNGWSFPHHLGHGIGLFPHESPRLNPHYDDTLAAGDVITFEPGLYGEELRGGIRIEQDYIVTENGLERLSHFPIDL
jgi:Xaa-Pro aminopeptidase